MGFDGFKGRGVVDGQEVEVYRNLHNGKISVRDARTKLVLGHADSVRLNGATFKVSEAGRQRVLATGRKNVHAVVRGTLVLPFANDGFEYSMRVLYNPKRFDQFMLVLGSSGDTLAPIAGASQVVVDAADGVRVNAERNVVLG